MTGRCNACRTCVQTNLIGLALGAITAAGAIVTRGFAKAPGYSVAGAAAASIRRSRVSGFARAEVGNAKDHE
jgi:hypothetical protein